MTENQAQQTEFTELPKEWKVVKLAEIVEYKKGKKLETLFDQRIEGTLPYLNAEGLRTGIFTEWAKETNDVVKVNKDDIILIWDGFYCGDSFVGFEGILSSTMIKIEPKEPNLDKRFLFYFLKSRFKELNYKISGMYLKHVNKFVFESLKLPLPPLPEQRKIAEILSTVDEAIQKVDEAIRRTERLKRGLMQKLLTKGIGHKEFKDTEIGRIPKKWEVVKLQDIVSEIKNGFASGKRDENGIVQVRMNNVTTDGRLIFDSYIKVPPPENLEEWILKPGDLLFNNTNSYDLVGKSAIFETAPFPCTFSNHFTRIRFKEGVVPKIILWHFLILWRRGYFKSVAIRHVGQSAVHTRYLLRLKIPLPPLSEQRKIAEILSTIDEKLELERKRKEKLERIKQGLMSDLLSGKIRVKP